jgi:hypothetical protein
VGWIIERGNAPRERGGYQARSRDCSKDFDDPRESANQRCGAESDSDSHAPPFAARECSFEIFPAAHAEQVTALAKVQTIEKFDLVEWPAHVAIGAVVHFAMPSLVVGFSAGDAPVVAIGILHASFARDIFAALDTDFGDDGGVGGVRTGGVAARAALG